MICTFAVLVLLACGVSAFREGTAFTYQGRLIDNGNPANGSYSLRFSLFHNIESEIGWHVAAIPW